MAIFGNQLKAARAIIDISQAKLAKEVGINQSTLRRMEAAGAEPACSHHSTMQKILDALGRHGVALTRRGVELIGKSEGPDVGGRSKPGLYLLLAYFRPISGRS